MRPGVSDKHPLCGGGAHIAPQTYTLKLLPAHVNAPTTTTTLCRQRTRLKTLRWQCPPEMHVAELLVNYSRFLHRGGHRILERGRQKFARVGEVGNGLSVSAGEACGATGKRSVQTDRGCMDECAWGNPAHIRLVRTPVIDPPPSPGQRPTRPGGFQSCPA